MRLRSRAAGVALLLMLLLLAACSMVKEYQQKDDFNAKTEDFALRMKWSDFVGVSLHFRDDLREAFLERFEEWDLLRVTDLALLRVESKLVTGAERKIAHYRLEYYLKSDMKVRKQKVTIAWELTAEGGAGAAYWRIIEPFPRLEGEKE